MKIYKKKKRTLVELIATFIFFITFVTIIFIDIPFYLKISLSLLSVYLLLTTIVSLLKHKFIILIQDNVIVFNSWFKLYVISKEDIASLKYKNNYISKLLDISIIEIKSKNNNVSQLIFPSFDFYLLNGFLETKEQNLVK